MRRRRITDDGWTAEIEIPFSTVRFVPSDEQIWGVNFQRHTRRKNERAVVADSEGLYADAREHGRRAAGPVGICAASTSG